MTFAWHVAESHCLYHHGRRVTKCRKKWYRYRDREGKPRTLSKPIGISPFGDSGFCLSPFPYNFFPHTCHILLPWRWNQQVSWKCSQISRRLHSVMPEDNTVYGLSLIVNLIEINCSLCEINMCLGGVGSQATCCLSTFSSLQSVCLVYSVRLSVNLKYFENRQILMKFDIGELYERF